MLPSTRIKVALRRRYGYAALRHLRITLAKAIEEHIRRTVEDVRPYNGAEQAEQLYRLYWQALKKLRDRWPSLNLEDERAVR